MPGKVVINDYYSQQTNFVPIITTPCSNLVLRIDCPGSSNRLFLSNFNYQQTWISRIVKTEPVGGTTFPPMALALARSTGVVTGAPLKGGRRHQGVSPFYNMCHTRHHGTELFWYVGYSQNKMRYCASFTALWYWNFFFADACRHFTSEV